MARRAARADQVRPDDRLAVAGRERVQRTEDHRGEQRQDRDVRRDRRRGDDIDELLRATLQPVAVGVRRVGLRDGRRDRAPIRSRRDRSRIGRHRTGAIAKVDRPLVERSAGRQLLQRLGQAAGEAAGEPIGVEDRDARSGLHADLAPADAAREVAVLEVHGPRPFVARGRQRGFVVEIEPQREAALLGRKAGRPPNRVQRHRVAVDGERQLRRVLRRELRDVVVALLLRRHAVAVGVGQMQLAQRRQLSEHHRVMDVDGRAIEGDLVVLVDREVAEQARDRVGRGEARHEHACEARESPPQTSSMRHPHVSADADAHASRHRRDDGHDCAARPARSRSAPRAARTSTRPPTRPIRAGTARR